MFDFDVNLLCNKFAVLYILDIIFKITQTSDINVSFVGFFTKYNNYY